MRESIRDPTNYIVWVNKGIPYKRIEMINR